MGSVFSEINTMIKKGFMENGKLKIEVIDKIDYLSDKINKLKISNSSIRKIYDNLKDIELKVNKQVLRNLSENEQIDFDEEEKKAFKEIKVDIKLMKSKINYILERKIENEKKNKYEYINLKNFLSNCLNKIETKEDFKGFLDLLECIIGYMKDQL
ncbi:type III-A CRISPR-associated protein Csm2 [Crassaminicella thermophila]|uniref:CRISPR system Cms protein Csm2 n=1 Tax=Crassaminicella thermophila TaxID=2599308 RepID=A0A5C0SE30_CRATE|nr:type III-A CRISPR-associated protein Csm2 [Crassaminicella thermophila]QEK11534.1 type III-A CRISPR-associated protein Csm2 [Crassaminicella thermophila]